MLPALVVLDVELGGDFPHVLLLVERDLGRLLGIQDLAGELGE